MEPLIVSGPAGSPRHEASGAEERLRKGRARSEEVGRHGEVHEPEPRGEEDEREQRVEPGRERRLAGGRTHAGSQVSPPTGGAGCAPGAPLRRAACVLPRRRRTLLTPWYPIGNCPSFTKLFSSSCGGRPRRRRAAASECSARFPARAGPLRPGRAPGAPAAAPASPSSGACTTS